MDEKELHLAQYNQIFEQRRSHINVFWSIPVTAAIVSYLAQRVDVSQLSVMTKITSFVLLLFFLLGIVMLSLRHNFIQKAYCLLLQEMEDRVRNPLSPLPLTPRELRDRYHKSSKLVFWERMGGRWDGIWSWAMMLSSAFLFIFVLWFDLEGKNILKF
ncbi:MAG: hypothetical protein HZC17_03485 [Candidatus Omnitrophica bacterium]|nr:hypothetical protein [Candidatus Omnitrophota bacterium]